tara:strand:+ start:1734 stop:2774 length:1041 start_codon:yes stop_codon:yes gene_type:complete
MKPEVSIIIPILNERDHIEKCVESVINSTKSISDMELFLVDGGSTDGTIEILSSLSGKHAFIRILHNEKKMIGAGINIGITHSNGDYIVRLDAHAIFPDGYIEVLLKAIKNADKDVVNIGGALTTLPSENDLIANSIAIALSSRIGVGNSPFRVTEIEEPRFVETVPFGIYRREVFEELGLFNENVPRSEDLELSQRIIDSGKKIMMIPEISATYYSRADLSSFIRQQFDNGRSVTKEHKGIVSFYKLRHVIPLLFVSYILLLGLLQLYFHFDIMNLPNFLASLPLLIYFFSVITSGFYYAVSQFKPIYIVFIPFILICLHISYGLGSLYGILQIFFPNLPTKSVR